MDLTFELRRVYDHDPTEGYKVLVDRLWPRGISKQKLVLDGWWKELTPSPSLRKWFHHEAAKWDAFQIKYLEELKAHEKEAKERLKEAALHANTVILLYAAKDPVYFHAKILKSYLEELSS
ncbi:DUF488 domain-containing protein [Rhabdochlamydiaceae symbiont of Dictyostelium giganteum]|uniref:DUF488 domain-containing protein n=1 Tax=Rhabdochlamydiaceae symbiont of Dictyostelium giganteum TaxID=3342349 RepID=UPI00384CB6D6